ncbi:cytochrome P450 [Mycobacteroides salmoniphilum]|uniref:Pentalenene oxygenase n=1 Tax=Mycobacteroides salmoniphilum TaxID=404941 RepID=A0A4R8STT0_9MYCO|nr:cytochrome P450 [Mycobacteroides salmoniphilum]TEA03611.1 Pentalenene oxygenase [Mycobacteroides salmoniphilum]
MSAPALQPEPLSTLPPAEVGGCPLNHDLYPGGPTFLRWHDTKVGYFESWRIALGAVWSVYRHSIFEYVSDLPGQDDLMVARAPMRKLVVVRNPEIARYVLVANQDNYIKSAEYDLLAVGFGRGLVTDLNEALWNRNRRLVQPIFAKRQVDLFAPQMAEASARTLARWDALHEQGTAVDVTAEMNYLTMDIVAQTMFGIDLAGDMAEKMRINFARLLKLFGVGFMAGAAPPLRWIVDKLATHGPEELSSHTPRLAIRALRIGASVIAPRTMRGLRWIEHTIDQLIADHRSGRITRQDNLLALLMAAEDPETGAKYTDLEIRDELMTFLGAGFETTAAALAWTWYLLSRNPEARAALGEEVDRVLQGRLPTAEDIDNLPWTMAVINEAMRVCPPIIGVARTAKERDVLGDYPIEAGSTVAIVIDSIHQNERIWENASKFDPSRFLKENLAPEQRKAHMPFGAGKRMCIASGFANLEAVIGVAALAQQYELDLLPGQNPRREVTFTGGPEGEMLMRLRKRHA